VAPTGPLEAASHAVVVEQGMKKAAMAYPAFRKERGLGFSLTGSRAALRGRLAHVNLPCAPKHDAIASIIFSPSTMETLHRTKSGKSSIYNDAVLNSNLRFMSEMLLLVDNGLKAHVMSEMLLFLNCWFKNGPNLQNPWKADQEKQDVLLSQR
jgi:hypothetical protein